MTLAKTQVHRMSPALRRGCVGVCVGGEILFQDMSHCSILLTTSHPLVVQILVRRSSMYSHLTSWMKLCKIVASKCRNVAGKKQKVIKKC